MISNNDATFPTTNILMIREGNEQKYHTKGDIMK